MPLDETAPTITTRSPAPNATGVAVDSSVGVTFSEAVDPDTVLGGGVTTAFAVRGFGYYDARYFADVDYAFTCSRYLTDVYRERIGLISTPFPSLAAWRMASSVEGSSHFRRPTRLW